MTANQLTCPECGRILLDNGVMLSGNVLTNEPQRPVRRLECPDCLVIVAGEIDEEEGWQKWVAQGNKRPDPAPVAYEEYRVALSFELCDESEGMMMFGRPQDFRVKQAHWQYAALDLYHPTSSGKTVLYHTFVYARRWKGPGKDFVELKHDEHPTPDDMLMLAKNMLNHMGGFPVSPGHSEPMAWNDPLQEDDFLDPSDNPDEFDFVDPDEDDFEDEFDF